MSTSAPIRFFGTSCEFAIFSNMFPAKFTVNKVQFPTNEHFFQAKKFETTDPAYFEKVRTAATAKSAKALGKSRQHPIRSDWNAARVDVMTEGVRAKFSQNEDLKKKLIETGDRELQECAPRDNFWGTGAKNQGANMLGKILMNVRSEFVKNSSEHGDDDGKNKNNKYAKKEVVGDVKVGVAASRAGKKTSAS